MDINTVLTMDTNLDKIQLGPTLDANCAARLNTEIPSSGRAAGRLRHSGTGHR